MSEKHTDDWSPPRHAGDHGIPSDKRWYKKFLFCKPSKNNPTYRLLIKIGRVKVFELGLSIRTPRIKAFEFRPWLVFF